MDPFIKQYQDQINELNEQNLELAEALEIYDQILEYMDPVSDAMLINEANDEKHKFKAKSKKNAKMEEALKDKKKNPVDSDKLEKASNKSGKVGRRAKLAQMLKNFSKNKK
jgi:hypothetical protein